MFRQLKKKKVHKYEQCIPMQKKADDLCKKKVLLPRKSKIQISFNLKYAYCGLSRQSENDWADLAEISSNVPELQVLLAVMPPRRRAWVNFSREPWHPGISSLVYLLPNILISPWEERGCRKHEQRPNPKEVWLQQLACPTFHLEKQERSAPYMKTNLLFNTK